MLRIDEKTRLSELIEENEKAIDAIAKINSNFDKLKNPVLRKIFANKVSIKEAAKIGGVHPNIILDELSKIGFLVNYPKQVTNNLKRK